MEVRITKDANVNRHAIDLNNSIHTRNMHTSERRFVVLEIGTLTGATSIMLPVLVFYILACYLCREL